MEVAAQASLIHTARWNDPPTPGDGYRLLVTRYRPRGVARKDESWDAWLPQLGPSKELHGDVYGKNGPAIAWDEYAARYVAEMEARSFWIRGFAERIAKGNALTLLCSSACVDPGRCHRTLLRALILDAAKPPVEPVRGLVVRRGRERP